MRGAFLGGAALLVVVANAYVLARVAQNRAGEPDATLSLTERELTIGHSSDEDSGVALTLNVNAWRPGFEPVATWATPSWLTGDKLSALGFDTSALPRDLDEARRFADHQPARRAYAVLQYGGSAWNDWMKAVEAAFAREPQSALTPSTERRTATRLFFVDVGTDPDVLRAAHPDRSAFLILPARVDVTIPWSCRVGACALTGEISLLTGELVVPHRLRAALPAGDRERDDGPRYRVVLHTGARREPWIESITPLAPAP